MRISMEKTKNNGDKITVCPFCGSRVVFCTNDVLYGELKGDWPYIYRCVSNRCDSYVGVHPNTDMPLGTLANLETRRYRRLAHVYFDSIWRTGKMRRRAAYEWLAKELGISSGQCHIALFDVEQCKRVVDIVDKYEGVKEREYE